MRWEVPDGAEDRYPEGACPRGRDLAGADDLRVARSYQQQEIQAERVQHGRRACRILSCRSGRGCVPWPSTWWSSSMSPPTAEGSGGPEGEAAARLAELVSPDAVDRMLADADAAGVSAEALLAQLSKRVLERALDAGCPARARDRRSPAGWHRRAVSTAVLGKPSTPRP
jgi:hypothetical protein